jgi:hypothetical protein
MALPPVLGSLIIQINYLLHAAGDVVLQGMDCINRVVEASLGPSPTPKCLGVVGMVWVGHALSHV